VGQCWLTANCRILTIFKNIKEGIIIFLFLSNRKKSTPGFAIQVPKVVGKWNDISHIGVLIKYKSSELDLNCSAQQVLC
jgi:hypothetical protein